MTILWLLASSFGRWTTVHCLHLILPPPGNWLRQYHSLRKGIIKYRIKQPSLVTPPGSLEDIWESSPSSVYLLHVEACTSYYPATRAEIENITPQKQSTLPLPTSSSKPWTLKTFSILILLDLSKAFDSMDHYILLRKISHLGASPLVYIVYSWFASYMYRLSDYNMCGSVL